MILMTSSSCNLLSQSRYHTDTNSLKMKIQPSTQYLFFDLRCDLLILRASKMLSERLQNLSLLRLEWAPHLFPPLGRPKPYLQMIIRISSLWYYFEQYIMVSKSTDERYKMTQSCLEVNVGSSETSERLLGNQKGFKIESQVYCNRIEQCSSCYLQNGHIKNAAHANTTFPSEYANARLYKKPRYKEAIAFIPKTIIQPDNSFPSCSYIYRFKALFDQSCYIIQLIMELAIQNVRKSHKLLMTATFSQRNASGVFRSSNFPQNDEPTTHNTSSTSCERKRFKTIQKNGYVRFVQQKEMAAVKPVPDRTEADSNSQHHLRHKRSSTSIQFRSDAVTETMKVRLEGKIEEARNKLEAMKMGFQRCLEKKQEIVNNVKNAKIVTRRYSLAT